MDAPDGRTFWLLAGTTRDGETSDGVHRALTKDRLFCRTGWFGVVTRERRSLRDESDEFADLVPVRDRPGRT